MLSTPEARERMEGLSGSEREEYLDEIDKVAEVTLELLEDYLDQLNFDEGFEEDGEYDEMTYEDWLEFYGQEDDE